MDPWSDLSADEMLVLESIFWSAGTSRHDIAAKLQLSKTKANALIAALVAQGLLMQTGHALPGTEVGS